jgi:hypothetical protein
VRVTAIAVTAALLFFLMGSVWVFAAAPMFVQYFYDSHMVALTHTFTLGWVSLMILGVLRQLAPFAFGLEIRGPGWISAAATLLLTGITAMVAGFASGIYSAAAIGTIAILLAVLLFTSSMLRSFRNTTLQVPHYYLRMSLIYFGAAAAVGAWMGLAKGFDVPLPAAFHRVLFAHIHLAGAGWAGMMIIAVMSRLFPQPHLRHPSQARWRFLLFNVGLIGLSSGLLLGGAWYSPFGAMLAVASIWYAIAFLPVLQEFRRAGEASVLFIMTAWCVFASVGLIGLWFTTGNRYIYPITTQLQFVYGFIYVFGWLSLMIFGMLYRIIPTHISKLFTAKGWIFPPRLRGILEDTGLQTAVYICLLVGLIVSSAGILEQNVRVFRAGWIFWLAGIAGFTAGLVRLGRELKRTADSRKGSYEP